VGRAAQLERLRAGVAEAERRLLAISGDPGIGKTRLLAELAHAAYADGATVLYGRCCLRARTRSSAPTTRAPTTHVRGRWRPRARPATRSCSAARCSRRAGSA
jgi:ATP-dependent exoDNAse (exonuclease V) alpha subunit